MIKIVHHLKAALLIAAFILTVSFPAFADEDQNTLNIKKIESARILKDKAFSPQELAESASSMANGQEFSITRLFQGLGLCIAAFLIGIHIYKRYVLKDKINLPKTLRVVEKIALNGKSQLCIVQYNDKRLLLAVGSDKVSFFQDNELLSNLGDYPELREIHAEKESCSEKVN
jgi:flagellar biogenesis protein FliO